VSPWPALRRLTGSTLVRFLREPRVVRSLVWPSFLGPVTFSLTLLFMAFQRAPDRTVAVTDDLSPSLVQRLDAAGWQLVRVDDAEQAVGRGLTALATDGRTVYTAAMPDSTLALENEVRTELGAAWRMEPYRPLPPHRAVRRVGSHGLRPLAFLFALYAMVFSMGSVARDHDERILDVERSLPAPDWVPGLARWNATVLVLGATWAFTVGLMVAMVDAADPIDHLLRGLGAIAASSSVGLALIGGGGIRSGFSAAFASGSFVVGGLIALGWSLPPGRWLPLASILTDGPGASSALLGLASGPFAALWFAWRVRRAS
jgi:hypothetical protein